jgi:hypothetical protein
VLGERSEASAYVMISLLETCEALKAKLERLSHHAQDKNNRRNQFDLLLEDTRRRLERVSTARRDANSIAAPGGQNNVLELDDSA